MKKLILFAISILIILISCEKEEDKDMSPKNINASDGFYVGCIHIEYQKEQNVAVQIERREKGTDPWTVIAYSTESTSFEDNEGYIETGMPPGRIFEYRIKNSFGDNPEYSEIEEGFAFEYVPVTEIEIESYPPDYDGNVTNFLSWNAGNHNSFLNDSEIYFNVCRSTDSLGTYEVIATVGEDRSYTDVIPSTVQQNVFYRIDIFYEYSMITYRGAGKNYTTAPLEGTIRGTSSGNANPIINYTSTLLGQLAQSSQGGISQLLEKNINGTLYLGLINEAGATGYGIPELYKLNGTTWQKEWSVDIPNEFNRINYAIASGSQFVAGINDSLCVYEWNGSAWGDNLASDNLGKDDSPSAVSIEMYNDDLYMAITQHPDYDLQVLKYDGNKWETIGGDANGIIASGTIRGITIEEIGNNLYLHYMIDNTLYIKHLEGTSWQSDLSWSNDNVFSIDLAASGNDLYFTTETNNSGYLGGVYRVTSTSTTEEIILGSNTGEDSFRFPESITIDTDGNLIVVSFKYNTSTASFYPHLKLYDGTDWKTISGDFSDGIDPAIVSAIGTDLIYVYGEGVSENASGEPTIIKSKRMTKQ